MHFTLITKKKCFLSVSLALPIIAIAALFTFLEIQKSAQKPMWGDELYSLEVSVRRMTVRFLVKNGAPGQGSPAPLDYLSIKGLDSVKAA